MTSSDVSPAPSVVAVDIGNSQIKLGLFVGSTGCDTTPPSNSLPIAPPPLPEPQETLLLPLLDRGGQFDAQPLDIWIRTHGLSTADWRLAGVHRGATDNVERCVRRWLAADSRPAGIHRLTSADVALPIRVAHPQRVGIDRLAAAVAANRLRRPSQPAVIVDHGSALTVDLLDATGAFVGGAIAPGTALGAWALAHGTDALPLVELPDDGTEPPALGTSTEAAMRAGLYWGAVGTVRELLVRMLANLPPPHDIFVTGGGGGPLAHWLRSDDTQHIRHVPHLVLAGIAALADAR